MASCGFRQEIEGIWPARMFQKIRLNTHVRSSLSLICVHSNRWGGGERQSDTSGREMSKDSQPRQPVREGVGEQTGKRAQHWAATLSLFSRHAEVDRLHSLGSALRKVALGNRNLMIVSTCRSVEKQRRGLTSSWISQTAVGVVIEMIQPSVNLWRGFMGKLLNV